MKSISKVSFVLLLGLLSILPSELKSQDYNSAIGVRIGTYFSASYKAFISEKKAFEVFGGITRNGGESFVTVGAYYKFHNRVTYDIPTMNWYYGAGVFGVLGNDIVKTNIAISGIIGLEYSLEDSPFNFFIDGSPYLSVTDGISLDSEASIGVRYIFGHSSR